MFVFLIVPISFRNGNKVVTAVAASCAYTLFLYFGEGGVTFPYHLDDFACLGNTRIILISTLRDGSRPLTRIFCVQALLTSSNGVETLRNKVGTPHLLDAAASAQVSNRYIYIKRDRAPKMLQASSYGGVVCGSACTHVCLSSVLPRCPLIARAYEGGAYGYSPSPRGRCR